MEALLPPGLDWVSAALLIAASAATSALTAAFGLGGGVTLLALMASLLPPAALIAVHGLVQLGSNAGRAGLMAGRVAPGVVVPFALASGAGALAGAALAVELPPALLRLAIGGFVLAMLWGPPLATVLPGLRLGRAGLWLAGLATGWLTMLLGATGPFVGAAIRGRLPERETFVATLAVLMTLQHGLKIAAFGLFGFAFAPWLPLALAMVATGFLGTLAGRWVLVRLDEALFQRVLSAILTLLALRLVLLGAAELLD